MSWNPVLDKVIEIKNKYNLNFDDSECEFEKWLEKLDDEKYNEIFDCLQLNQNGKFLLIRYGLAEMQKGMWEDENSIYRECRSVVIDLEKECLVLTPFRKFFNLNEVEENKLDNVLEKIKIANVVEIVDKLDGSMQSARWYEGDIFMAGSMAIDKNNSWRLQEGYSMLTDNHKLMIENNKDYTFIFEYISIKDSHVVLYDKSQEGLYLIGIRDTMTGKQMNYSDVELMSVLYNVPMAEIENITIDDVLEQSKLLKSNEKEGWVLNIDGHFIKIKCDDYVHLHRLLDKFSSVNVIIENIAEDRIDDMLSKVPDSYKNRITYISDKIIDYKNKMNHDIEIYYDKAPKDDLKKFMIWVNNNVPDNIKGYVRNKYKGKEINVLKNSVNGYKKLKGLNIAENYSALFSNMEV